jgi:hypothetical protein
MKPHLKIDDIPVFVFERHSDAIIPWALTRRELSNAPALVTFDQHTDTLAPFLRWGYYKSERILDFDSQDKFMEERLAQVDFCSDLSISSAAKDLWHDEHIRAAMGAGVIGESFVIAFNSVSSAQRVEGIHYLPSLCYYGCAKLPHDDECARTHADLAIDDDHLEPLLAECSVFQAMLESDDSMVLDIDLDYFRTLRSLSPGSSRVFRSLASRAVCITIATEPMCVENGRFDDEVDLDWALNALLTILENKGEQGGGGNSAAFRTSP